MDGASVTDAVLSLMPLDTYIDNAALCMEVFGGLEAQPEVQKEAEQSIDHHDGAGFKLNLLERCAFCEKATSNYAILAAAQRRFYGCFILAKCVVLPEE